MYGHSKGVRDLCFTGDGKRFISAGMEYVAGARHRCADTDAGPRSHMVRLWDTETGAVRRLRCVGRGVVRQRGALAVHSTL